VSKHFLGNMKPLGTAAGASMLQKDFQHMVAACMAGCLAAYMQGSWLMCMKSAAAEAAWLVSLSCSLAQQWGHNTAAPHGTQAAALTGQQDPHVHSRI